MWFAPPEYVILRKLAYYRDGGSQKHLYDIRSILDVSGDELDFSEIDRRVDDMGLRGAWKEGCFRRTMTPSFSIQQGSGYSGDSGRCQSEIE